MQKRLKNTDLEIFPIVLGSDYYGGGISEETAFSNLDEYIKLGGNIVDTARIYGGGESERVIGKYIASRGLKNKLVISTKAAHPPIGHMERHRLSLCDIESDVDKSLALLGVERIDILWLHRDNVSVPVESIADAVNTLIKKGKVRSWGVSNWTGSRIKKLNEYAEENGKVPALGGQIQWALARCAEYDKTLVAMNAKEYAFYSENKMPVFAYASQAKGFFEKYRQNCLSKKACERYLSEENVQTYKLLEKVSAQSGFSLTALGLAYLIKQKNFDTFPIIGCSKTEYVTKAFEALSVTDDAVSEIMKIMP